MATGAGQTGQKPGRPAAAARRRGKDLQTVAFPVATADAWVDPVAALTSLFEYVEAKAQEAADWYLRDKRTKSLLSQGLRALAIGLAAGGGVFPLVDAATPGQGASGWGYVLLALAAACVGFDRFFGLSSAWMRDITTAQTIQRRLERFRYDWAAECLQATLGRPDVEHILRALQLIRQFGEDVADQIEQETTDWVIEFQHSLAQLEHRAGREWGTSGDRREPSPRPETDPSADPRGSSPQRPGERLDRT